MAHRNYVTPDQNAVIAEVFIAAPPASRLSSDQRPGPASEVVGTSRSLSRDEIDYGRAPRRQMAQRWRGRRWPDFLRGRRVPRSRSAATARTYVEGELQRPADDGRPLGTGAAQRSRTASERPEKVRHRNASARASRKGLPATCRSTATSHGEELGACPGMARSLHVETGTSRRGIIRRSANSTRSSHRLHRSFGPQKTRASG